jgi:arylsulfatase A-like enzyme
VDHWVGELIAGLDAAGLADSTAIVLVSDHGEGFFTHSYAGKKLGWHGQSLYDDVTRVPILFIVPGTKPHTVDTPVMLLDVAPTILELAGVAIPPEFQGRSLVPALRGQALEPREVHAELLPYPNFNVAEKMVVTADGKEKLVHDQTDNVDEVFDLVADPGEQKNLAFSDEARTKRLRALLAAWVDSL